MLKLVVAVLYTFLMPVAAVISVHFAAAAVYNAPFTGHTFFDFTVAVGTGFISYYSFTQLLKIRREVLNDQD